jgi:hypothetical protein
MMVPGSTGAQRIDSALERTEEADVAALHWLVNDRKGDNLISLLSQSFCSSSHEPINPDTKFQVNGAQEELIVHDL